MFTEEIHADTESIADFQHTTADDMISGLLMQAVINGWPDESQSMKSDNVASLFSSFKKKVSESQLLTLALSNLGTSVREFADLSSAPLKATLCVFF